MHKKKRRLGAAAAQHPDLGVPAAETPIYCSVGISSYNIWDKGQILRTSNRPSIVAWQIVLTVWQQSSYPVWAAVGERAYGLASVSPEAFQSYGPQDFA